MIYNSEFCNESMKTLEEDMSFEQFADLSDKVMYYMDLKQAAEEDSKTEQARQDAINKVRPRG